MKKKIDKMELSAPWLIQSDINWLGVTPLQVSDDSFVDEEGYVSPELQFRRILNGDMSIPLGGDIEVPDDVVLDILEDNASDFTYSDEALEIYKERYAKQLEAERLEKEAEALKAFEKKALSLGYVKSDKVSE